MAQANLPKRPNLDSVTTINEDGSRYFLHPSDVKGPFTLLRRLFGVLLLAIYVALPWIQINGKPAVFFDVSNRQFHFFGLTFLTTDLWIGFFLLTGLGFALFYITALLGRLWCGWACPYTVFLEHIYRRIERMIDGDAPARRRLDAAPWTTGKVFRRFTKHALYLLVSAMIAHVFVSYFISIPRLYEYMRQSPLNHVKAFSVMLFLTVCLYGAFSWFREQFCIILCPYGRIQSALTDDDTMIIGYDEQRGEPRGKAKDLGSGHCVDCHRCVQVCPTGIDIRNGLQMECIGCAACIDACNDIMGKLDRPRGLIRYDSFNGLAGKKRRIIRPRILLYTGMMLLGCAFLLLSLRGVHSAQIEVTRMSGQPFYLTEDAVRNQFNLRFSSKRNVALNVAFKINGLPETATVVGLDNFTQIDAHAETIRTFFIAMPKKEFTGKFHFTVIAEVNDGEFSIQDDFEFIGPSAYTLE